MALQVTNESGVFMFDVRERRWLCLLRKKGSFMANCFVPLEYGNVLTSEAKASGATDADFGIHQEKEKPVREKGVRTPRPSKVQGKVLWDFS